MDHLKKIRIIVFVGVLIGAFGSSVSQLGVDMSIQGQIFFGVLVILITFGLIEGAVRLIANVKDL